MDRHSLKQQYRKQRDSNRGKKRASKVPQGKGKKMLNRASRALTAILRHNALDRGLQVRPDGYVQVSDLLKLSAFRQLTLEDLQEIESSCEKQRFKIIREGDLYYMRANQGHSMPGIDPADLLTQIGDPSEILTCIHGTYKKFWSKIRDTGLNKMTRNHIHFTTSEVQNEESRSGFRKSCDLLIYIDTTKAMSEGCIFFRSANNVILSPGFDGIIPSKYFAKVIERHSGNVVFCNDHMEEEIQPSPSTSSVPSETMKLQTQQSIQQSSKSKWEKGKSQRKAQWEKGKGKSLTNKQLKKKSRALTTILRHKALDRGLEVRPDGYVKIDDLTNLNGFQMLTLQDLQKIEADCEKQRFKIMEEDGVYYIRANQGHSMPGINAEDLLTRVEDPSEIPLCIHGTYLKYWDPIRDTGLNKMGRHNIHFTTSEVQNAEARSGFRKSCDLLIFIDVERAMQDGCVFFRSANNVILSPGFDGVIPSQYFSQVIKRRTREKIFPDSRI